MQPLPLEVLELKFAEGWQVNPGKNPFVFAQSFSSPTTPGDRVPRQAELLSHLIGLVCSSHHVSPPCQ